jgi:hypothetical protein
MLAGLMRLRRGAGGSFHLSNLLWKQVGHCRFLLVVMLSHCIQLFSGCHLARYCHRRRTPASGKPASFILVHTGFHYLSPFYTVVAAFFEYKWLSSFPLSNCNILIGLGSALNIRHFQHGTFFSCATDHGRDSDFICLLNTVVFIAIDGCNYNRCHSDVSFFDKFCISSGHDVRYSPIFSQIFSTLTVLQVILM